MSPLVFIVLLSGLVASVFTQQTCVTKMDLMLVLDHSCSIDDKSWQLVESFAQQIVQKFDVGPDTSRFGCVQFASTAPTRLEFGLLADKQQILKKLTGIPRIGCGTDIARGIALGRQEIQQNGRKAADVAPVMLMMTDGRQSTAGDPHKESDITKSAGIELFVIGVGNQINRAELMTFASTPTEKHVFFGDTFNQLQLLLSAIINNTCVHITCPNIVPNHGPAAGGTTVTITGIGFTNSPKLLCKFGNTVVAAKFIDSQHLQCVAPAGTKGTSVSLAISLDGVTFTSDNCQYTYDQYKPDPCAQWDRNCSFCISHAFCGWCSNNVTLSDGTSGSQCAGFNHGNSSGEQPFVCEGTYHTEECAPGYKCDWNTATCNLVEPGNGDLKETCQSNCGVGSVYRCNTTTNLCNLCPSGTPGCVNHIDCQKECLIPGIAPEVPPTPGVPGNLVNTIWRGFHIHKGYDVGEYRMQFGTDIVRIRDPTGNIVEASVESTPSQLLFIFKNGPSTGMTVRSLFSLDYVGQVVAMTLASGNPGDRAPVSFDEAMTMASSGFSEFLWFKCLNSATCNFRWDNVHKRAMSVNDYCMNFTTCDNCVKEQTCGWCSNKVIYDDGTQGTNCAGYDPNGNKRPFVCRGTFATDTCDHVIPPQTWSCDQSSKKCVEVPEGSGTDFDTCNNTCNHVLPPPIPVTPTELIGKWRALQIHNGYIAGEYKAEFGPNTVTLYDPSGNVILSGDVSSSEDQVWVTSSDGSVVKSIWQINYGTETKNVGWALGKLNGPAPLNYAEAMMTAGESEYVLSTCLDSKITNSVCAFDH